MDYEKKYKDAMERAQKATRAGSDVAMDIVQYIFPELIESEDEMALKGLQNFLWRIANGEMNDRGTMPSAKMCQEWIVYLEKQKEQKPIDDKAFEEWLNDWYQGSKELGGDIVMSEAEFKNWSRGIRNMYEQKPEWSEEDEKMAKFYEADYNHKVGNLPAKQVVEMRLAFRDWIVNRIKYLRPQPKQEWSEEDEENISKLHRLLVICQGEKKFIPTSEYEKLDSWLTSLRPQSHWKSSEQKKQKQDKWSKKDTKILQSLHHVMNCADAQNAVKRDGLSVEDVCDFLFSIEPN